MHGPVTIARDDFPVLALAQDDATRPGLEDLVSQLCSRDVPVMTAGFCHDDALALPGPSAHPVIEPLLRIQSFYRLVNALSLQMGLDPDSPPYLKKVTSTV